MIERIIIAGTGGQGIVTLGKMLARTAMDSYPFVTFFPSYGAEVRGGVSSCQVILSTEEIASPLAEKFDTVIAMNQQAAERFVAYIERKGLAIANSTLCRVNSLDWHFIRVQATKIADQLGNIKAANLVMLGSMLARKSIVSLTKMEKTIRNSFAGFPQTIIKINLNAFRQGLSI
ncbi:MAG: 2-oxoacid:acceptor oxidoreductase family protein [Kiritimatiellae bacterium]|jgi:2-oxoglutarate ferredoxin oxidoreductase subunit gamma|nr:2-oxoacid:acceptor oxidoreductase family protein [Kiritimatiellia bacterium]